MHLIHVGRRRINAEYILCDEEGDGSPGTTCIPPGSILVTLKCGKEFLLSGEDAESYRRQVDALVVPDPAAGGSAGDVGTGVGDVAPLPLPPKSNGGDEGGEGFALDGLRPQSG